MSVIDDVLADPLARARAAERAIGYVGFDVPEDLLAASGRFACHLPWDADRETPRADGWLETSFPGWARSMLEDWADGRFDFLEAVIFSRGDDAAQRLYYYICELQRRESIAGPRPLIFDMAKVMRPTSVARTVNAVRCLAAQLDIDDVALAGGIVTANRRRALLAEIAAARGIGGAAYARLAQAALFAPIEDLAAEFIAPSGEAAGRVLLAGTAPPDDRLHRAVAAAGWDVAAEATDLSLRRLGPAVAEDGDAAAAIGAQAHGRALGARAFADRAALLARDAAAIRAGAVVLWLVEEEEALVWQLPAMTAALEEQGVPVLAMTRRRWDCGDGAGDEIAGWLKELKA